MDPPWLRATVGETGDGVTPPDDSPREALSSDGEFTTTKLLETPNANLTAASVPTLGKDVIVLTTTILGKTHRAAVVNGRLHREGDRIVIAGETFRLASVAEDRIELESVGSHSASARSLIIRRAPFTVPRNDHIVSRRHLCVGSGSLLVAATTLSRDALPTHRLSAATDPNVVQLESLSPARIVRESMADEAEPSPPPTATTAPLTVSASEQSPIGATAQTPTPEPTADKSTPFQNAALRSAPPPEAITDQPTSSISTKTAAPPAETTNAASSVTRPVVVLKPQERRLASLDNQPTPPRFLPSGRLATSSLGFIIRTPQASPTSNT